MVLLSWNSHSSPAIGGVTGFFSAGLPTCQNTATQAAAARSAAPANTFQVSAAPYSRNGIGMPKPRDRERTPPAAQKKTREYLVMALSGCIDDPPWCCACQIHPEPWLPGARPLEALTV